MRLIDVNEPQHIEAPADVRAGAPEGAFGNSRARRSRVASAARPARTRVSLDALTSPNPRRAARAVHKHKKVVILFQNPRGLDDQAIAAVDAERSTRRTKAVVLTDDVPHVDRYGKLLEDLGVNQTPVDRDHRTDAARPG